MFSADGHMITARIKLVMKKNLQVTISERNCPNPETVIYDVSALLWVLEWPCEKAKLNTYINTCKAFVFKALQLANVTLVFDRYYEGSIKSSTRRQRMGSSRVHNLKPDMPTPPKHIILSVTKNKIQLNAMLVQGVLDLDFYTQVIQKHCLTVAGVSDVPIEITYGVRIERQDLSSSHEEADMIITQHAISASLQGKVVRVVCDDTDVFVLLVHYYNGLCTTQALMFTSSPKSERLMIDIRATAVKHADIANDLLAIHGLSGADTVASLQGIGKGTALKIAKKGNCPLTSIGDTNASMDTVLAQATKFICATYGKVVEACMLMTECRLKIWKIKTGKSTTSSPKPNSLPPTDEAFMENVWRCHLQVAVWKSALCDSPQQMDPCQYGWELDPHGVPIPCSYCTCRYLSGPSFYTEIDSLQLQNLRLPHSRLQLL